MKHLDYIDIFGFPGAQSAWKLSEEARSFLDSVIARCSSLTEEQRFFFSAQSWNSALAGKLLAFLKAGGKPSAFFRQETAWVRGTCILHRHWDAFLWAVDACIARPYPQGWMRRPFRSNRYSDYVYAIIDIAKGFSTRAIVDADLCDILAGDLPGDAKAYTKECGYGYCAEIIAYEVNQGNERLISLLMTCLNGDEGAPAVNRQIFKAIQLSDCAALHIQLGKLLLAARLQEGLRQTICEVADEGTIPAFQEILRVISENNLIRFSAVRRAVGVWTGLGAQDPKDLERISDKTLSLLLDGLNSDARRESMLQSENSMEIYIGLWAAAVTDLYMAVDLAENIVLHGSRHQAAVCCFFVSVIQVQSVYLHIAKKALARFPEDPEVLALCLQAFLTAAGSGLDDGIRVKKNVAFEASDAEWYPLMETWYQKLSGKEQAVPTDVFPWLTPVIRKADLALILCGLAVASKDDALQDKTLALLPQVTPDFDHRASCMKAMLTPVRRLTQKAALMAALADKAAESRKVAFKIADKLAPEELDIAVIENHLRLKPADLRTNCLKLLVRQDDEPLMRTVERLLADSLPQKRAAGYDLILQIASDPQRSRLKARCADMLPSSAPQEPQEKLLWESASKAVKPDEEKKSLTDGLFDESDRYKPDIGQIEMDSSCRESFVRLFPDSVMAGEKKPFGQTGDCPSCAQARHDLDALYALIDAHREDPINKDPFNGEEQLLGYGRLLAPVWYVRRNEPFPDAEIWEEWYTVLGCPERLVRVIILLEAAMSNAYENFDPAGDLPDRLFGTGFQHADQSAYAENAKVICAWLLMKHGDPDLMLHAAVQTALWLIRETPAEQFMWPVRAPRIIDGRMDRQGIGFQCVTRQAQVTWILSAILCAGDETWPAAYTIREALFQYYAAQCNRILAQHGEPEQAVSRYNADLIQFGAGSVFFTGRSRDRLCPGALDDLKAVRAGLITERTLFHRMFQPGNLKGGLILLSQVSLFVRTREGETSGAIGRGWNRRFAAQRCLEAVEALTGKRDNFTGHDMELLEDADRAYLRVMPMILESELRRGDTVAEWSFAISSIQYIRGIEWLGKLLAALGKSPLQRSTYGLSYQRDPSRVDTLSYMLSVSIPAGEDDTKALAGIIRRYEIPERRLVELAMYNTAWAPLIGEYFEWPGFVSAVTFFIAHMNETFDEERKAVIAQFTPLSPEELNGGAFDIEWFRSVWDEAGDKRFGMLYDAAKYITDNARHTRARKYADAVLGRMDSELTERQILDKRNKDLLLAYALIPLSDDAELLRRFLFIQRYIKDSRQFGAQRSAAERKTGEMALVNLATNSGDCDVIRLTLRMEGQLTDSSLACFEPVRVEDVTAQLVSDPAEGVRVLCEKDGKALKAVPARLKKHPDIQRLTEAKKQLTEQARRCRRFLEEAMDEGIRLSREEIRGLRRNRVIRPMVDSLVMMTGKDFGLPCDAGLSRADGSVIPWSDCSDIRVAHPYHLFSSAVWPDWQKAVFNARIVQPFKQVFRELYVKTADELGHDFSLRYAGYQIQPRKAAATLRTRRWTAGAEEGLQKVFYRDNLIAVIMARADWFTPSDVEAPTLESVRFFERLGGKPVLIDQVPELVFSEVMRDVDLAVSVAYVGGVDPEASHSTVEMRAALLNFALPMFGIQNVRIDRNHAIIQGKLSTYTVHLGSGIVHQQGGTMLQITAVHSQHRGKLFLPFADDDPQTAEILTKVLFLAEDSRIRDPKILEQIR